MEALLLSQLEYERKASATSWAELKNKSFQKSFLIPMCSPTPLLCCCTAQVVMASR